MEAHGNTEGTGGTYTAPYGTGRYEGIVPSGEWRTALWPAALPSTAQGCNPNRGTYRLR